MTLLWMRLKTADINNFYVQERPAKSGRCVVNSKKEDIEDVCL